MATGPAIPRILTTSPAGLGSPAATVAAARAGALALLDFAPDFRAGEAIDAARQAARFTDRPIGLRLPADELSAGLLRGGPLRLIVAVEPEDGDWSRPLDEARELGVVTLAEVTSADSAARAVESGVAGLIVAGREAGGQGSELSGLILLQSVLARVSESLPVWVRGGVGPRSASALVAAGARGVVLDGVMLLARESPLPAEFRDRIARGLSATVVLGPEGARVRVLGGLEPSGLARLREAAETGGPDWWAAVRDVVGWQREGAWPVGLDAGLATEMAARHRTIGRMVQEVGRAIDEGIEQARNLRPLAEGSPTAVALGVRWPIVQAPLPGVFDSPAFASAVADAGGLPLLSLDGHRGTDARPLLTETVSRLAGRSWGVGLTLPPDAEVLTALAEARPALTLVDADACEGLVAVDATTYLLLRRPDQVRPLLRDGHTRIALAGDDAGGLVGQWPALAMAEHVVNAILEAIDAGIFEADSVHLLISGGVHDGRSAAAFAALVAPAAAQGIKFALLVGTAYLFTEEAVATGAVVPGYQSEALRCRRTCTVPVDEHRSLRVAPTPLADHFATHRDRLARQGPSTDETPSATLRLALDHLRIAARGIDPADPARRPVHAFDQHERGLYALGEAATLRSHVTTLAALHRDIVRGAASRLDVAPIERADDSRRPCPTVAIAGLAFAEGDLSTAVRDALDDAGLPPSPKLRSRAILARSSSGEAPEILDLDLETFVVADGADPAHAASELAVRELTSNAADLVILAGPGRPGGTVAVVLRRLDDAERDGDRILAITRPKPAASREPAGLAELARAALSLFTRTLTSPETSRVVPWLRSPDGGPRRAGDGTSPLSSPLTLEEYEGDPGPSRGSTTSATPPTVLVARGADSREALVAEIDRGLADLERTPYHPGLATNPAPSPAVRTHRMAVVARSADELRARLTRIRRSIEDGKEIIDDPDGLYFAARPAPQDLRLAFLIRDASDNPIVGLDELALSFPEVVGRIEAFDRALREVGAEPVGERIVGGGAQAQPMELASTASALLGLLASIGLKPDALAGLGFGEWIAFQAAGLIPVETLAARARGSSAPAIAPESFSTRRRPIVLGAPNERDLGAVVESLYDDGLRVFVEVGTGSTLVDRVDEILGDRPHLAIPLQPAGRTGVHGFLLALARLWVAGVPIALDRLGEGRPTPFHPCEVTNSAVAPRPTPTIGRRTDEARDIGRPHVGTVSAFVAYQERMRGFLREQRAAILGELSGPERGREPAISACKCIEAPLPEEVASLTTGGIVLVTDDDGGVARAVAADLRAIGHTVFRIRHGVSRGSVIGLNLTSRAAVAALLERLRSKGPLAALVHLRPLDGSPESTPIDRLAEEAADALVSAATRGGACILAAFPLDGPGTARGTVPTLGPFENLGLGNQNLRVRLVGFGPGSAVEVIAADVVREIFAPGTIREVAYLDGRRLAPRPVPVSWGEVRA